MAKQNKSKVNQVQEDVLESARKVWLAGLGAVSTLEEGTTSLFEQLVEQGQQVSSRGKQELDKARNKVEGELGKARTRVEGTLGEVGGRFDRQVSDALHRLGIPTRKEIQALTRRVEELTTQVDQWQNAGTRAAKTATATAAATVAAAANVERKVYHVTATDDGWKVQAEGAERAAVVKDTKEEALNAARELAKNQEPSQVVVHKMDGKIQNSFTYGDASN